MGDVSSRRAIPASERCFRALVALFPRDFRDDFATEMGELFRDQLHAARRAGGARGVASLWLHTVPAVVWAAALAHRDAISARAPRRESMFAIIGSDLRHAGRMLRKSPLFTVVAVLCVALGSGAVTTIFSAMNALVLRPLPGVADASRLVRVERTHPRAEGFVSLSNAYYEQLRGNARSLDEVAAWSKVSLAVRGGDEMGTSIYGNFVSGNFFRTLGVRPALGRFFVAEEDRTEGTHPVIVVSERFWRSRLGADSAAIGRELRVNGHRFTLVGVAPASFAAPTSRSRPMHGCRCARDGCCSRSLAR
jgi:putative ABC transport system permease protein